MPANPANFRFAGVDGRGRQELVRDPRNGGAVVVQIEDKDGGAEGYTFDLFWDARGPNAGGNQPNYQERDRGNPNAGRGNPPAYGGNPPNNYQDREQRGPGSPQAYGDQYRPNYRESDYYRRYNHAFRADEAIRVCQQAVLNDATRRFHSNDIHFHRTAIDDNPGRNDWVTGTLDVHRGPREDRFGFSCSVDFDSGRVRSAVLDPRPLPDDPRWH